MFASAFAAIDRVMLWALAPLAIAILISGLDDLVIDIAWLVAWLSRKLRPHPPLFPPGPRQLDSAPQQRIAILLPLWQEGDVIGRMIEHNLAAIRFSSYHFFAGAYPNDQPTTDAVRSLCERFDNVHLVMCPHDGPTSKADCLNWIYRHLCIFEADENQRFDVIVTHDAEDLIHPDELRWINFYSTRYDFIQTPVLALQTPLRALTHGIYCDEFAEYHTRDMQIRPLLGGFLPSAGVGTGYRRDALRKLAEASGGRVFEPEALTEDYENGLKLFRLGCSQAFVPISRVPSSTEKEGSRNFVATREFFPKDFRSALRQRTRWVMGIALQGWERYGWSGKPGEVYWLWRDRKGLLANPLSLASNVMFFYGLATGMWMRATPLEGRIVSLTICLQILRLVVRMSCTARAYGLAFALGVPLRAVYANVLNSAATFLAIGRYASARAQGLPLKWLKTEHAFPNQPTLMELGEYSLRAGGLHVRDVPRRIAHALPEHVVREWRVLPFRVAQGHLHVACPDAPSLEIVRALRPFTALEIRFSLVTAEKFEELTGALL
jgi:bacteriophage N4 adsorption protein B